MTVAGAVIERDGGLLLVKNRRRNGAHDWSTPGGVVDPDRRVDPATGSRARSRRRPASSCTSWEGPLYQVTAVAIEMGWQMHCEVHRAVEFAGDLRIDDPDGIVVDAAFVTPELVDRHLADCFRWVRDPLAAWLLDRWAAADRRGRSTSRSRARASPTSRSSPPRKGERGASPANRCRARRAGPERPGPQGRERRW